MQVELRFNGGTAVPDASTVRAALVDAASSPEFPLPVDIASICVSGKS